MNRVKDWLNRRFSKNPKYDLQMDEVNLGSPANKGRRAGSTNATDGRTRSVSKTEIPSAKAHLTPADSPPKESRSLSRFKIGRVFAKNKATNTTIKTASKDNKQKAKKYLQELGYSGSELRKIMTNLKNIPDEYYLDAAKDIPQKKFKALGYTSQRVAINDFDESLAVLMGAGFSTKDAKFAILHAQDNADKNNFRKSFKEIISSRVTSAISNNDKLSEAENDEKFMLSWAMEQLLNNDTFSNKQEAQNIVQDIYQNVSREYLGSPPMYINSIFMEKIHEIIKPPDYEQTEVKRLF
jgi:hypothetical protein